MKTLTVFVLVLSLLMPGAGLISQAYSQTETIAAASVAQDIAANAGGAFIEGAAAPALTGTQVALPIVEEATGQILGHIVAEQASLVSALNAAGYAEVATAIAAVEAGTVAGAAAATGLALGTTGTTALVVAGVAGAGLALSGNDDDGSSTTAHHSTTSHH